MRKTKPTEMTRAKGLIPKSIKASGDDGVDLTLIRWMLSLSPDERLQVLQGSVQAIMRLRGAKRLT